MICGAFHDGYNHHAAPAVVSVESECMGCGSRDKLPMCTNCFNEIWGDGAASVGCSKECMGTAILLEVANIRQEQT